MRIARGIMLILLSLSALHGGFFFRSTGTTSISSSVDHRAIAISDQANAFALTTLSLSSYDTVKMQSASNLVHPNMADCFYVSTQRDEVLASENVEGTNYTGLFLANLDDETHLPLLSPTITLSSQYPPSSFWQISPPPNSTQNIDSEYRYTWAGDVLYEQTQGHSPNIGVSLNYEPYPSTGHVNFDSRREVFPLIISNDTDNAAINVHVTPAENIERLCIEVHLDETDDVLPHVLENEVNPEPSPVTIGNFTAIDRVYWEFHNLRANEELLVTVPLQVHNKKYPFQVMYEPRVVIYAHQGTILSPWETTIGNNVTLTHPRFGNVTFSGEGEYTWTHPTMIPNQVRGVNYDLISASSENTFVHDGNLIISGTQTFAIENCTFIETGSIFVKDYANLSLKNSTLALSPKYDDQYNIYIQDNATAQMDRSILRVENWGGTLRLSGAVRVGIGNCTLGQMGIVSYENANITIQNSTLPELTFWDDSHILLENSTVTWTVNPTFYFPHVAQLERLHSGYYENWNLHVNETVMNVPFDLTVKNSVIAWGLTIRDDASVGVSNCEVETVRILISHAADLHNIRPGHHWSWIFNSIVLANSTVRQNWFLGIESTSVSITNSSLRIGARGKSHISLVNSSIDWFTTYPESFVTIVADASTLSSYLAIIDSVVHMIGDITFSLQTLSVFSSNITRNYNVASKNASDSPLESVQLTLFDRNNKLVWSGQTDSSGTADFNLTFTDSNYTDVLRLVAVKEELFAAQNVTFLFDTPVTMALGLHDIAMMGVAPAKAVVGQGHNLDTNFTVTNLGDLAETFYATIYANATNIGTYTVFNMANGTTRILMLACSTTGLVYGNYTISVNIQPVPGENFTTNNNYTYNIPVHVGVPGDISGPTSGVYDGIVNMRDISYMILLFNTKPSSTNWNPNTDINNDATVNMRDISIAILNFNKHE